MKVLLFLLLATLVSSAIATGGCDSSPPPTPTACKTKNCVCKGDKITCTNADLSKLGKRLALPDNIKQVEITNCKGLTVYESYLSECGQVTSFTISGGETVKFTANWLTGCSSKINVNIFHMTFTQEVIKRAFGGATVNYLQLSDCHFEKKTGSYIFEGLTVLTDLELSNITTKAVSKDFTTGLTVKDAITITDLETDTVETKSLTATTENVTIDQSTIGTIQPEAIYTKDTNIVTIQKTKVKLLDSKSINLDLSKGCDLSILDTVFEVVHEQAFWYVHNPYVINIRLDINILGEILAFKQRKDTKFKSETFGGSTIVCLPSYCGVISKDHCDGTETFFTRFMNSCACYGPDYVPDGSTCADIYIKTRCGACMNNFFKWYVSEYQCVKSESSSTTTTTTTTTSSTSKDYTAGA